ncbi:hypothetical protein [Flavobacterium ginsenosidimutans]|uniref:Uncharacterized protein n=1 Tax=Flavobacterium ginsenosidimutans TaxID=687844 RepID=A0ABZ2Q9F3_9FLAO|nr:hypothetical protein [Flavobacterium ginsenosidimutans]KAF2326492.1 hypothetical protein DM444_21615 [Flavobacterium ginsenosidimutans]
MERFDLCILKQNVLVYEEGTYAFILDMDEGDDYHLELWNFEKLDGADINYLNKVYLRLATKEEIEEYQIKFKEYCNRS